MFPLSEAPSWKCGIRKRAAHLHLDPSGALGCDVWATGGTKSTGRQTVTSRSIGQSIQQKFKASNAPLLALLPPQ